MRCPSCDAEIQAGVAECPECGTSLLDDESATQRIVPAEAPSTPDATTPLDAPAGPLDEQVSRIAFRLQARGWVELVQVAALVFLVMAVVGGVLVLAARLNNPDLATGGDVIDAVDALVIAGLAVIGVPVTFDGVAVGTIPLGAFAVVAVGALWAMRSTYHPAGTGARAIAAEGARLALPLGIVCWFAALVFRFTGEHPVAAHAGIALVTGAFWGAVLGAVGALRTRIAARSLATMLWAKVRATAPEYIAAATGALTTLVALVLIGAAATLMWFIVALARDAPGRYFDAGDAVAYIIYALAFFPNVLAAVVAIAFGAPVEVGARLTLGGQVTGPLREYSLWEWGRGEPPEMMVALLLVPLAAGIAGGIAIRRNTRDPARFVEVVLAAAAIVAVVVGLWTVFGRARLAGVAGGAGYGFVAADLAWVLVTTFLVTSVTAAIGWKIAGNEEFVARLPWVRRA